MEDYLQTHRHGLSSLAWARQMDRQYDAVDHFITHYGSGRQPLTWNSEAHFGGRFILTLQVPVNVDYGKNTVKAAGAPRFHLTAVESVTILPDGRASATMQTNLAAEFDETKWDELVDAGFDLSVLDIPAAEQKPIPNFDEYVSQVRRDRVNITPSGN